MMYRAAMRDDADMLLRWRNDPETVRQFRVSRPVTPEEHEAWLLKRVGSTQNMIFICFEDDHNPPVGVVRLDRVENKEGAYETSVIVAPEARGRGLGGKMLKLVCDDFPSATLYTEIHHTNKASMKSFGAAGFVEIGSYGLWTQWRRLPLK